MTGRVSTLPSGSSFRSPVRWLWAIPQRALLYTNITTDTTRRVAAAWASARSAGEGAAGGGGGCVVGRCGGQRAGARQTPCYQSHSRGPKLGASSPQATGRRSGAWPGCRGVAGWECVWHAKTSEERGDDGAQPAMRAETSLWCGQCRTPLNRLAAGCVRRRCLLRVDQDVRIGCPFACAPHELKERAVGRGTATAPPTTAP